MAADPLFNACMYPRALHLRPPYLCTVAVYTALAVVQRATTAAHPEQRRVRCKRAHAGQS